MNTNYWVTLIKVALILSPLFYESCQSVKESTTDAKNNDIQYAIELTAHYYSIQRNNVGGGSINEITAMGEDDEKHFEKEHNTEWYKFTISDTMAEKDLLSFSIEPNDPLEDYDFLLFKFTDENFQEDVKTGKLQPLRSNLAKNDAVIGNNTGLSCEAFSEYEKHNSQFTFSQALPVQAGEVYYLVVDSYNPEGKGYGITFSNCSADNNIDSDSPEFPVGGVVINDPHNFREETDYYAAQSVSTDNKKHLGEGDDYVIVNPKNTVYSIAKSFNMTVSELRKINHLKSNKITIGQRLKIRRTTAGNYNDNVVYTYSGTGLYLVNRKNTLYSIGKMYGMTVKELMGLNKLKSSKLAIGQVLKVRRADNAKGNDSKNSNFKNEVILANTQSMEKIQEEKPAENEIAKNTFAIKNIEDVKDKGVKYYMYLNVSSESGKQVPMSVLMVDAVNPKLVQKLPSNEVTSVSITSKESKDKMMIFDVFGYRKTDLEFNIEKAIADFNIDSLENPEENDIIALNDTIVINQVLERYKKFEIVIMYQVYFYDDAAIMLPKSKFELNSLLELMKENQKVKIKIHGHTNGNKMGKIIALKEGDKEFFNVTSENREFKGSATKLSEFRAEIIRNYLVEEGIDASRIEVKGWGGKKPLYDPKSPLAHRNKRVEVEILEE